MMRTPLCDGVPAAGRATLNVSNAAHDATSTPQLLVRRAASLACPQSNGTSDSLIKNLGTYKSSCQLLSTTYRPGGIIRAPIASLKKKVKND